MKVCIQIIYTANWLELAKATVFNTVKYCIKNNYTWSIQTVKEPYDAFEKIRMAKSILVESEADVVWVLDCDTLITNHTIKVENFINDTDDIFLCKDYNGINCGSFLIKKSDRCLKLLDFIYSHKGKPNMDCEQNVIEQLYLLQGNSICVLDHPSINSYLYENYPEIPMQTHEQGQWEKGDLLLHLPGISISKRTEIINKIKEDIIYE